MSNEKPYDLRLLGRFQLLAPDGQGLAVPSKKGQAILALLALAESQTLSRGQLTGLLWGDRGEDQARSSLRQALTALRKVFQSVEPSPLVIEVDQVAFAPGSIEIDAVAFAHQAETAEGDALAQLLDRYDGDFLQGIEIRDPAFEAWLDAERRRLHGLRLAALNRLLTDQENAGPADAIKATAENLLALDPLQEAAHRALMRWHQQSGERTQALRQFELCREILQRDLGVAPETATQELYQAIKQQSGGSPDLSPADLTSSESQVPTEKHVLAVLPFENLSGDPEQEFFVDGITRNLTTELGRLPIFSIAAAASLFAYKGRRVDVARVSRDLNAHYVVTGGVQKSGKKVRITAQLIDGGSGEQIWGNRFDGELDDLFDFQDEISRRIVSNLYLPLMYYASQRARQKPAQTTDAYDLFLRALHHIEKPTRKGIDEAEAACQRVQDIDPDFALVYEVLMWVYLHRAWNGWCDDPRPALITAREAAARGVALDSRSAYLLGSLGFIDTFLGQAARGIANLREAVDQTPGDVVYSTLYGGALAFNGQTEEALMVLDEVERLSPRYHVASLFAGDAHFAARRAQEALPRYEQFLLVLPEFNWAWAHVAACHVERGKIESAQEAVAKIRAGSQTMTQNYLRQLLLGRDSDVVERLVSALNKAGLPK